MRTLRSDDLNHVAVLNRRSQGNHPAIHARAGARVAYFRVNHVSEIDRRRPARQLDDLAHGSKRVNILRIEIELECVDEFARVLHFLRPFDQRAQHLQGFVIVAFAALPFLVLPMGGDAFFGNSVHLLGADLYFERLAFRTDYRGVQRLIKIVARRGNPVLESARHRLPGVVDYTESPVTMTNLIWSDDTCGHQIVDLIKNDFLSMKFFPD